MPDLGFYLLLAIVVILSGVYILSAVAEMIKNSKREKREAKVAEIKAIIAKQAAELTEAYAESGTKMIKAAKRYAGSFRRNTDCDITAICTRVAFDDAIVEHLKKIKAGELEDWDKVVCYAEPLFTFAGSEQTRRPIHTGTVAELDLVIEGIMEKITGIKSADVSIRDYERAVSIVFVRDSRLFVPYAGNTGNAKEMKDQFVFYGMTTLDEALKIIKL